MSLVPVRCLSLLVTCTVSACVPVVESDRYLCADNRDCAFGFTCDTEANHCVSALATGDAQLPPGGDNGGDAAVGDHRSGDTWTGDPGGDDGSGDGYQPCAESCVSLGVRQCIGDDFRECEYNAGEDCLEWGALQRCAFDRLCDDVTGQCDVVLQWDFWADAPAHAVYDVWGAAANQVWAAGANGRIWHWNGNTWGEQDTGLAATLYDVWGNSDQEIWAVGTGGTILRSLHGAPWELVTSPVSCALRTVHGNSADNVWAAGDDGCLLQLDEGNWLEHDVYDAGEDIYDLWVVSDGLWAIGTDHVAWRLTGDAWTHAADTGETFFPVDFAYHAIWGPAEDDLWATGTAGWLLSYKEGGWYDIQNYNSTTLRAIWGAGSTNIWAAGDGGALHHTNGLVWPQHYAASPDTTDVFEGLWGSSKKNIWLVGRKTDGTGLFVHFHPAP